MPRSQGKSVKITPHEVGWKRQYKTIPVMGCEIFNPELVILALQVSNRRPRLAFRKVGKIHYQRRKNR